MLPKKVENEVGEERNKREIKVERRRGKREKETQCKLLVIT